MRPATSKWAMRIALAAAVMGALGGLVFFAVQHATAGAHAVVRSVTDAALCEIELDPGVAGRAPTRIDRLAPRDTRGVEVSVGPLDTGGISVRYRPCEGDARIERAAVDPRRAIVLDGEGVRSGPVVRTDEE